MLRQSSINLYKSHWQKFVAFCQWKGINVFNVRSQLFYQYLVELFEDNTAPSTMISHHTSVGSVLKHWKYEPSTDLHVKVLRGMQLSGPVVHHTMRQWDLHLVLSALMCPPFAPAGSRPTDAHVDLKWWTLKTCFLVDEVTGRPWSFIHAQSVAPAHTTFGLGDEDSPSTMSLLLELGFMVKNQLRSQISQWATILGITPLSPNDSEHMLCHVRQLQLYLKGTAELDGGCCKPLFMHWNCTMWDISQKSHPIRG